MRHRPRDLGKVLKQEFFRASRLFKEFVKTVCITECRSRGRFQTIYSIILIIIDGNVLIYVWAFLIRPVNRSVHDFMIHPCTASRHTKHTSKSVFECYTSVVPSIVLLCSDCVWRAAHNQPLKTKPKPKQLSFKSA